MELLKKQARPSTRLNRGNMLLANTHRVDTKSVKARLNAFSDIHSLYIEAHNRREEAEALKGHDALQLEALQRELGKAIAALSAALVIEDEPVRNPFSRFSPIGPRRMATLLPDAAAQAVHHLVVGVRSTMSRSPSVLEMADKVEQAAGKIEDAVAGLEARRTYLGLMRYERNSLNPQWDTAYKSLRHMAKSVAEERDLYTVLFGELRRAKPKVASPPTTATPSGEPRSAEPAATADPPATEAAIVPPQAA